VGGAAAVEGGGMYVNSFVKLVEITPQNFANMATVSKMAWNPGIPESRVSCYVGPEHESQG
jgi:hypothetical protein